MLDAILVARAKFGYGVVDHFAEADSRKVVLAPEIDSRFALTCTGHSRARRILAHRH